MTTTISTTRNVRPVHDGCAVPDENGSAPNAQRIPDGDFYEKAYPRAADLERRCLAALRTSLYGLAPLLCGPRGERWFRAALEGESSRYFRLADLCRLATEPTREARASVLAVVAEIAGALGYGLQPLRGTSENLFVELAESIEAAGDLHAEFSRAAADGEITPDEALRLRPKFEAAKRQIADMEATLR